MAEDLRELYSDTVGEGKLEFMVVFRAWNGQHLIAYVYASDMTDARHQAARQSIDRNRIVRVREIGKRRTYGHI